MTVQQLSTDGKTLMLELVGRCRAWVLRLLGLVSKRDLLALETRFDTLIRELDRQTALLERANRRVAEATSKLEHIRRRIGTRGRLTRIERNLHALIRSQFVDQTTLPVPRRILAQRFRVSSQNEEDGLTLALINLAGTTKRRFLDLGAGASGGNTGFLAETCGWTGLMADGRANCAAQLAARFVRCGVAVKQVWLTCDNVNQVVRDHRLDGEIDLLSLDLNGNEYWVWRALDACSPRIVLLAFNAAFGADQAVTVPYDPAFDSAAITDGPQGFYGASLAAFEQLGREKGYRLVMVEPKGVQAYLLRNDVAPEVPASSACALHPHPGADAQPLLDRLAEAGLPVVDLASVEGDR